MKMLFTAPSVVPCDILKGILAGKGIEVLIKNELGSAGAGMGEPVPFMPSLPFAWPEVWVADEDFEDAAVIVREMNKGKTTTEAVWKCKRCGETVDAEFATCWKCDAPKDE